MGKTKNVAVKVLFCTASLIGVLNIADYIYASSATSALTSNLAMSARIKNSVTIDLSGDSLSLNPIPSSNGTFATTASLANPLEIAVYTNSSTGFIVGMTTSSTNLVSGSDSIPTLQSSNVSAANFPSDYWGYSVGDSTAAYQPVATTNTIGTYTRPSSNPAAGSTTQVNFGTKLSLATPPGTYSNTLTFTATAVAAPVEDILDLTYMQDFASLTSSEKTAVLSSMTQNQQYTLKDSRDQKEYYIAKLADGNVWMTQNLDFDIVNGGSNLNHTNTDVPTSWSDAGNLTNTYTTGTTTWNSSKTAPESYDPGDLCWNGVLGNNNLSNGTTDCDASNKHYHIGNYYNWTAAVAMSNSSSYTVDKTDVDQSICPAGWRLPTYGDKSYGGLVNTLNLTSGTSGNIQNSPVYFVYDGYWYGSSNFVGYNGYYWSSVVDDEGTSYGLYFNRNGYLGPQTYDGRDYGRSIRCVAR